MPFDFPTQFGIILFLFALLIGMLFLWWLRCKRSKASSNAVRNKVSGLAARDFPSKTANATGNGSATNGTLPNETSKLLLGMDNEGRPVMNTSYDVRQWPFWDDRKICRN